MAFRRVLVANNNPKPKQDESKGSLACRSGLRHHKVWLQSIREAYAAVVECQMRWVGCGSPWPVVRVSIAVLMSNEKGT